MARSHTAPVAQLAGNEPATERLAAYAASLRFEDLPAAVFVRGFLKSYCRAIGLDERETLRDYEGVAGRAPAMVGGERRGRFAHGLGQLANLQVTMGLRHRQAHRISSVTAVKTPAHDRGRPAARRFDASKTRRVPRRLRRRARHAFCRRKPPAFSHRVRATGNRGVSDPEPGAGASHARPPGVAHASVPSHL